MHFALLASAIASWSALETVRPIGHIESCYSSKFATPRQGALVPDGRARLRVECGGIDARAALEGLDEYSHVWLLWSCHLNGHAATQAKVQAPRLRGGRAGLFATRSPFRPNPIGLTLAKLHGVSGVTLELSGVDLVSGTPVVDVKPYLPAYDAPGPAEARTAAWVEAEPLEVVFAPEAAAALERDDSELGLGRRGLLPSAASLRRALAQMLAADPRPLYRWRREARAAEGGAEYEVVLDGVRARCVFERGDAGGAGGEQPRREGPERVTVLSLAPDADAEGVEDDVPRGL